MNKTTELAPCKVNLYLDVTGLRADGYHGIESVMKKSIPEIKAVEQVRDDSVTE